MAGVIVGIRHNERDNQRKLDLDKGLRESVAEFLRFRFPTNTAKETARAFRISLDQARHAVNGLGSIASIELIFKHGGWPAALHIVGAVIGQAVEQHFTKIRREHAEQVARIGSMFGSAGVGSDRAAVGSDVPGSPDRRSWAGSDRQSEGQG